MLGLLMSNGSIEVLGGHFDMPGTAGWLRSRKSKFAIFS